MRRLIALVLAGVAIIATAGGCGAAGEPPASKALGGLSDNDLARLRDFAADIGELVDQNLAVVEAFNDEDPIGAQYAVGEFDRMVTDTQNDIVAFDSDEAREALGGYMSPLEDLADAYPRLIAYYSAAGPADPAAENAIFADIQRAVRRSQRADRDLVSRLADVLDREDRDTLPRGVQQRTEDHQRRVEELLSP